MGTFASAVDAAKSGETSGSMNNNSNEMERMRRTSDLMQQEMRVTLAGDWRSFLFAEALWE